MGMHRSRLPVQTLREFEPLMPSMGITRLANITGLDRVGIPVFNAIRPNSKSLSVSQGKGLDDASAKVSALMESIEYWHAENVNLPIRSASYRSLFTNSNVVDITELSLRLGANARDDLPYYWVQGFDLMEREPIWTPFETVSLNKVGLDYANTTFRLNSNGLASGNTWHEAVLHGLYELVERDATTAWWVREPPPVQETKVDPITVTNPLCRDAIDRLQRVGLMVALWDITSDVGIPTYQCCVIEPEDELPAWSIVGPCWGWGCHLSPDVALCRCVIEAAQSRLTIIAGSRDDGVPDQYVAQHNAVRSTRIREAFFIGPTPASACSLEDQSSDTLDSDLAIVVRRLHEVGIRTVVAVNLMKEALRIPVVKVIVPGLEHSILFPGYAPGRRAHRLTTLV